MNYLPYNCFEKKTKRIRNNLTDLILIKCDDSFYKLFCFLE